VLTWSLRGKPETMTDSPFLPKMPSLLYQNSDLPLADPTRLAASSTRARLAAVLIPLIWQHGQWQVLFIRRTENAQDRHSGQVAFPGGARDPDDQSAVDTALRETFEEIGIPASDICVVGELDTYTTSSQYQVTPVIGTVNWPVPVIPAPDEVARVFYIPLAWLNNNNNFTVRPHDVPVAGDRRRQHPVIYFDRYEDELLWGASARMTLNFCHALEKGRITLPPPAFVSSAG